MTNRAIECFAAENRIEIRRLKEKLSETFPDVTFYIEVEYEGEDSIFTVYSKRPLKFNTAWSFPEPVIKKLSETFPDVTFCIEVEYEGEDSIITVWYKNGELIQEKY